jgi:1-acyl-sn-glycerol-3-phosphate acyltransferase
MSSLPRLPIPVDPRVAERVERLELPFGPYGIDPYGVSKADLGRFFTILQWLYTRYFTLDVAGIANLPPRGRVMLVANHSGGLPLDGAMIISAAFFAAEPPRLAQGMVEKFLMRLPFTDWFTSSVGQFTGLPEHAHRLLEDDRCLLVFPEGVRGVSKLYDQRDSLVRFGTGFMRLAMATSTPIVPVAFVGGGEAIPTVRNLYGLGKLLGVPYVPLTPYLLPVPLPVNLALVFGTPMQFARDDDATDEDVALQVEQVRDRIGELIRIGRDIRDGRARPDERDIP